MSAGNNQGAVANGLVVRGGVLRECEGRRACGARPLLRRRANGQGGQQRHGPRTALAKSMNTAAIEAAHASLALRVNFFLATRVSFSAAMISFEKHL